MPVRSIKGRTGRNFHKWIPTKEDQYDDGEGTKLTDESLIRKANEKFKRMNRDGK